MEKTLVIMGNGPSLKDVDFEVLKKYDTFGLNSAYRVYKDMNFYPTYFGCFDYIVCENHKKNFSELVLNTPIKKFFFLQPKFFPPNIQNHPKFQKINFIKKGGSTLAPSFNNFFNLGCSGSNAVQVGILLGYKRFILLGCDCNYVEIINGAKLVDNGGKKCLKIVKQPSKNPNYWFDNYQQVGDKYNLPNPGKFHITAWNKLNNLTKGKDIEIINCSLISKIPYFPKKNYKEILV